MIKEVAPIDQAAPKEMQDWVVALASTAPFDGVFVPDVEGVDEAGHIAEHLRQVEIAAPGKRYAVRPVVQGEGAVEGWEAPGNGYLVLNVSAA